MAQQVFTVNGKKIKTDSLEKAQYLYNRDFAGSSSSSSKPTTVAAPVTTRPTTPASTYSGGSVVDYLGSTGQANDFNSRSSLATKYGISGYTGSADQNTKLLAALRTPTGGSTSTNTGAGTSARDTYIAGARDGLANANNSSATTPETTHKKTSGTPDYRQQYIDYLSSTYPTKDVASARTGLDAINKRIADATLRSRTADDTIRENDSGALARGVDAQLTENSRLTSRELGDLGIAAAPFTSVINGADSAYKTLASLTPADSDAFTLSQGQTRYEKQADGTYKDVGSVGKVSDDPVSTLSSTGSLKSGNLNYTNQDYTEDSNALEQSRGADGWVDPSVYQKLYNGWISSGGTAQDFVKIYPPTNYANPDNTWLPGALRNTKGGGSAARTQVVEIGGRRVLINLDTGATIQDLGQALGTGDSSGWGL